MIKHIVMWKLKDPANAAQFKAQLDTCSALVPGIHAFEVAIRQDHLESNMDVVLYSVFEHRASLDAYQTHPQHQAVSAWLGPLRETRCVLDYEI
jgi:quinol monooxygenase YgiN